ncbi:MAG: right-handed parallel beta-helix repeat-containing protein [Kiritimatiellia bacterium]
MKKRYVWLVGVAIALAALSGTVVAEGTKTVGGREYVYLTAPDTSTTTGQNSFCRGDNWSDGIAPHGDADYLVDLGPESRLHGFANFGSLVFAGRSLTLGNADTGDEGWASVGEFRPLTISNLWAVAGGVAISSRGGNSVQIRDTEIHIQSTAAKPFVFELRDRTASGAYNYDIGSRATFVGGDDAVFEVRAANLGLAKNAYFSVYSRAAMSNYCGRLRIVGTNVWWSVNSSETSDDPVSQLGPEPAAFRPDHITLAHGGVLRVGSYPPLGNRGITVGEGGGRLELPTVAFSGAIAGPGVLTINGYGMFHAMELAPGGVLVPTNATVRLADSVRLGAATGFEVENGGTLHSPDGGLAVRAVLHGGARVKCGVAAGERYCQSKVTLHRRSGGAVGTVTLSAGSRLEGVSAECPILLAVEERDNKDYVSGSYGGRVPLLRVPVAAGAVSSADFAYETGASGVERRIEVETADGMQTVYAVHAREATVESGDDLAAIVAAAAPGTVVRVRPGVYAPAATIELTNNVIVVSDDGDGRICPELVIVDGGATEDEPSAGHQVFRMTNTGSALIGLTIRNGFTESWGGGVYVSRPSSGVSDCIISNCYALSADGNGGAGDGIFVDAYKSGYYDTAGSRVANTVIVRCKAGNGGGAAFQSYQSGSYASSEAANETAFVNCAFIDNEAIRVDTYASGGGIRAANGLSHCRVEGCLFRGNWTTMTGDGSASSARMGAAMQTGSYSTVTNCVFDGNGSCYRGMINGGPTRVFDCVFRNGVTRALGDSVELAENCVFTNNLAGFSASNGSTTLRNCLYADNDEPLYTGSSRIENCTIVSNRNCGVFIGSGNKPVFVNTVVAHNGAPKGLLNFRGWNNLGFTVTVWRENVTVSNCCFQGIGEFVNTRTGMSNDTWRIDLLDPTGRSITSDPRLVDVERGDYRLARKSPCRDAGLRLDWMTPEAIDLAGNPRVVTRGAPLAKDPGALPDLGCYENVAPPAGFLILVR